MVGLPTLVLVRKAMREGLDSSVFDEHINDVMFEKKN